MDKKVIGYTSINGKVNEIVDNGKEVTIEETKIDANDV